LKVQGFNDFRQTEIHTAEPLVPESSDFEVEVVIEKLKRHKSPRIDRIPAEFIRAGSRKICSETQKPIHSIWNQEEFPVEWIKSIIVSRYKKGDKTPCSHYRGMTLLSTTYKTLSKILLSRLTLCAEKIIGIISVDFDATGQLLIIYCAFAQYFSKNENALKQCISYLQTSKKPVIHYCIIFSLSLLSP
jgi:hypothetical protein